MMNKFQRDIEQAIAQRSQGTGSGAVVAHAPDGHLLSMQVMDAAMGAARRLGEACVEAMADQAGPGARVLVRFADPLEDLPHARFAPYQAHEIVAIWQPEARYQDLADFKVARASLVARLQPLVIVHALEGEQDRWAAVMAEIGGQAHDLSLTMDQAFAMAIGRLGPSRVNDYLASAVSQELPGFSGMPRQLFDGLAHCASALERVEDVDHEAYQARMARLPDAIAQGLGGVAGSQAAMAIGEKIHSMVSSAHTPMPIKLARNRAGRAG